MEKIKFLILLLLACGRTMKTQNPARLRIVNAISDGNVHISIRCESQGTSDSLAFMETMPYRALPSGKAKVRLSANGKMLLEKTIGLGNGEKYTLVLEGLSKLSSQPNQETFNGSIHRIFGGSEADSPNGFLPGFIILRDDHYTQPGKTMLRAINAVVGTQALEIVLKTSGIAEKKASWTLKYPKKSDPTELKAGDYQLEVRVKDMPKSVLTQPLHLEPCGFYTLILSGSATGGQTLKTQLLQNDGLNCP